MTGTSLLQVIGYETCCQLHCVGWTKTRFRRNGVTNGVGGDGGSVMTTKKVSLLTIMTKDEVIIFLEDKNRVTPSVTSYRTR